MGRDTLVVREWDNRLFGDSWRFPWHEAVFRKEQRDELRDRLVEIMLDKLNEKV